MRLIILLLVAVATAALGWPDKRWTEKTPPKIAAKKNPYGRDAKAAAAGKKLYAEHCAACHGTERQGSEHVPPLRSATIENATDGQIFWLLREGILKSGMPSWSHLPPQQRWQIVTFLKSGVPSLSQDE